MLVSTQNSLNDEWIAPVVGPTRDIGCVLTMSSEVFEPGHLKRNTAMDRTTFIWELSIRYNNTTFRKSGGVGKVRTRQSTPKGNQRN